MFFKAQSSLLLNPETEQEEVYHIYLGMPLKSQIHPTQLYASVPNLPL